LYYHEVVLANVNSHRLLAALFTVVAMTITRCELAYYVGVTVHSSYLVLVRSDS